MFTELQYNLNRVDVRAALHVCVYLSC